jgi:predicted lipoprotein with Yx(FWY)xxD motif
MRALRLLCAGAVAVAAGGAAVASARPIARSASASTVELRETSVGMVLVDPGGFTLYGFTLDKRKHDSCVAISGCAEDWPPDVISGSPIAGPGLNQSKLSTITLPDGAHQVTYYGHALYHDLGASEPGDTRDVGSSEFGGKWYALTARGKKVL